jgi:dipeptidyl-peptidase-4
MQWYADQGFLVLQCDNRGSCRRGVEFEGSIKNRLGEVELQDQEDVLRYFIDKGLVDEHRIGITGWSYGGYLSLMALCRHPSLFHAAAAGAPVVSW